MNSLPYISATIGIGCIIITLIAANRRNRRLRASYERYLHTQPLTIQEIQAELQAWDGAA